MTSNEQIAYWRRRHEADPESRAFAPLANLCLAEGLVGQALDLLAEGLARHPTYVAAWLIKGRAHLQAGDAAGAERALSEALRLDPENLIALGLLASAAERRGDRQAAERFLVRLARLDPGDETVRQRLAAVRAVASAAPPPGAAPPPASGAPVAGATSAAPRAPALPEPAAEAADPPEAPARAPQATATLTLARIYRAQGHPEKALEVLRQAHSLRPDRQEIRTEMDALERELAAPAPVSTPRAAGGQEPAYPAPGRQESRSNFEQWLAQLAQPRKEDLKDPEGR